MTGNTLTFYDAAYPPETPPATDGVCFYLPGGDAEHGWTKASLDKQTARYRLPVFVRSDPDAAGVSATSDVTAAITQLHAFGVPDGSLVAWDVETTADPAYITAVYRGMHAAGYQLIVYGSQSTVLGNDNPDGLYWGADWTGVPHLYPGYAMTQYVDFGPVDESLADPALPFWDTKPGTAPAPSIPAWQEAIMQALPEVQQGATGTIVRTIQGLCCARGFSTAIDGDFGAQTSLAVIDVQRAGKLATDGVVGPKTWPALLGIA
jgi:hypothetical protein